MKIMPNAKSSLSLTILFLASSHVSAASSIGKLGGLAARQLGLGLTSHPIDVPAVAAGTVASPESAAAGPLRIDLDVDPANSEDTPREQKNGTIDIDHVQVPPYPNNRVPAAPILAKYGITVEASPNSQLNIGENGSYYYDEDRHNGSVFNIKPNAHFIIQDGGSAHKVEFTLRFNPPVASFEFTRPELHGGGNGIWFPKWEVRVVSKDLSVTTGEGKLQGTRFFNLNNVPEKDRSEIAAACTRRPDVFTCATMDLPAESYKFSHKNFGFTSAKDFPGITSATFSADAFGSAAIPNVALIKVRVTRKKK